MSACIITYNEADRIEACLRSLSFCDEIVVVDSHSTDATRELAAKLGARVIERDWPGYRSQKQFAVDAASHDWVLCLDADERVSDELRAEIEGLRASGALGAAEAAISGGGVVAGGTGTDSGVTNAAESTHRDRGGAAAVTAGGGGGGAGADTAGGAEAGTAGGDGSGAAADITGGEGGGAAADTTGGEGRGATAGTAGGGGGGATADTAGGAAIAGWSIPRITDYFGRFLRHGNAYPDRLVRLFDRRRGGWTGYEIHENTRVQGRVGKLHGHLEHYSYRSLTDHHNRMQRYANLMAQALYDRGKRCGLGKVIINPQWRFVRGYFLRLGFLDGWRGLVFALVEANYVRRKYLGLYIRSRGLPP